MAATVSQGRITISRIAADTITVGKPVFFNATAGQVTATTIDAATANLTPWLFAGIAMHSATVGQVVEICVLGACPVKITTGANILAGVPIAVNSTDGQVVIAASTEFAIGRAIDSKLASGTAVTDDDLIECLIQPGYYHTAGS